MARIEHSFSVNRDRLDTVYLRDGDRLRVTFPDGHSEAVSVVVHGPKNQAHARIGYHDVACLLPLVGLEAVRDLG